MPWICHGTSHFLHKTEGKAHWFVEEAVSAGSMFITYFSLCTFTEVFPWICVFLRRYLFFWRIDILLTTLSHTENKQKNASLRLT